MIQCPHCHWIIKDDGMPETDLIKLRDGEVVLYRRGDSPKWQARYKTPDQKWHRISTKRVRTDDAKVIACAAYDRARFREAEGFISVSRRFRDVAKLTIHRMDLETAAGRGKVIFKDYQQVIDKYLIPYFGSTHIDKIDVPKMQQFEAWRMQQMKKAPAASTILNPQQLQKENQQMLEMHITTKSQLMELLAGSEIKLVVAKDVHDSEDLNDIKKSALQMLRNGPVTAFLVAN
jgi:hypothetical protein